MSENPTGPQPTLVLEIALPSVYTADLETLVEMAMDWDRYESDEKAAEFEAFLNALQIATSVGVRMMAIGEKDSEMVQVKGTVIGARLDAPSSDQEQR